MNHWVLALLHETHNGPPEMRAAVGGLFQRNTVMGVFRVWRVGPAGPAGTGPRPHPAARGRPRRRGGGILDHLPEQRRFWPGKRAGETGTRSD